MGKASSARKTAHTSVTCIRNDGYPASLEVGRTYRSLPDKDAVQQGYVRVVDESGEDYLYPAQYFSPAGASPSS